MIAQKPPPDTYPTNPKTFGEHLRARRLDRELLQRDAAAEIGTTAESIRNWELGQTEPPLNFLPAIIRFIGYDPRPPPQTSAARLVAVRRARRVSREQAAREMRVDPCALRRWEVGESEPSGAFTKRVQDWLNRA